MKVKTKKGVTLIDLSMNDKLLINHKGSYIFFEIEVDDCGDICLKRRCNLKRCI